MSGIDMSYQKLKYFSGIPQFQEFIRNIFAKLKTELNADFDEILEWLNTEINEADVFETKSDLEYPLYEYAFPCWIKKFRDMYDIQVDEPESLVVVLGNTIWIGSFTAKSVGVYDKFDVFSFLISLRKDYDGTVAIMKNILSVGNID